MSIKDIKNRIKSIKNIGQITKAMGLVSATKLQKMRTEYESSRQFFYELDKIAENIPSKKYSEPKNKNCIILISSNRGLCGTYNINVSKMAIDLYNKKKDSAMIVIGSSAKEILKRNNIHIDKLFEAANYNFDSDFTRAIANEALSYYENGYEIYIAYTKFFSAMKFIPEYKKVLPLAFSNSKFIFEPDPGFVMDNFISNFLSFSILNALIESCVCEQSARMMSMNAASDNAAQIISDLKLKFNMLRQNQITQELTEIISGANALKN